MYVALRRALSITTYVALLVGVTGLSPVWLPITAIIDQWRRSNFTTVRILVFLWIYLASTLVGLAQAGLVHLFIRNQQQYISANFNLQRWWARMLFSGVVKLFRLKFSVEGAELLKDGPYLLFMRHTSIVDTLLPSRFTATAFGTRLRYIMKKELLIDPGLDVVGQRLPNYFVDRRSTDKSRELERIAALCRQLQPNEAVVIWPEGTRFTPSKWKYAIDQLSVADPKLADRARQLTHVMPPRAAGAFAMIDAAPEADVVFCAHTGFEGFANVEHVWGGGMVGVEVRVKFWRVAAKDIPTEKQARVHWLFDQWSKMDEFAQRYEPKKSQ
eukprot:TRINITY_DN5199_c0_g2_i1.p1 TRINITY_DN5199_c0_g2~~TRINITY_DN5199_c0_g2_i1.p1  ORF type:complete len:328 (+),score=66.27 TRINITY_DN5199_c0_g2_i1:43-1026(+)